MGQWRDLLLTYSFVPMGWVLGTGCYLVMGPARAALSIAMVTMATMTLWFIDADMTLDKANS